MEINEFQCKLALRLAELEQKGKKLAELSAHYDKKGVSLLLFHSFLETQQTHKKAMAVGMNMLPTKEIADAYMTSQLACYDFINAVVDGMIKAVENHNKNNKK